MTLFKQQYRSESTRLPGWDYATAGWYFVTLCTKEWRCVFGDVVDGEIHLSPAGEIVAEEWEKTPQIRPETALDQWVVMPNHLHGILILKKAVAPFSPQRSWPNMGNRKETPHRGNKRETPHRGVSTQQAWKSGALGAIMGQFKSICTKRIWAAGFHDFAWQPRFFDHIIRDEKSLQSIREYIFNNPQKWQLDKDNPENLYM